MLVPTSGMRIFFGVGSGANGLVDGNVSLGRGVSSVELAMSSINDGCKSVIDIMIL